MVGDIKTVRIVCTCRYSHEIEFRDDDGYLSVAFWTTIRNWMSLWRRIAKAWDILFHGSAIVDDVQIADIDGARAAAKLLNDWADDEETKRIDFCKDLVWDEIVKLYRSGFLKDRFLQSWVGCNYDRIKADAFEKERKRFPWLEAAIVEYERMDSYATELTKAMRSERGLGVRND